MVTGNDKTPGLFMVRLFAIVVLLFGLAVGIPGARLLSLGGSAYYLVAGVLLVVSAVLVWRLRRMGALVFLLFLMFTLVWSIWESGFDGWALLPRLTVPLLLGLWLCLPMVRGRLSGGAGFLRGGVSAVGALVLSVVVGAGLYFGLQEKPVDPIYQTGTIDLTNRTAAAAPAASGDWPNYGNDKGGSRYSRLDQLNASTVGKLDVAWTYRMPPGPDGTHNYNFEATPIKVGNTLYLCSVGNVVVALDAETGRERWKYDPQVNSDGLTPAIACRGVSWFKVPEAEGLCAERILTNTIDARLIALDAHNGRPCPDFGENGQTSLLTGMGDFSGEFIRGYYYVSSAPTIIRGKVVLGGWISDGQYWGEPSGVIRAYDATTGAFVWAFDMGRPDRHDEPGEGEFYTHSTPNSWAPMSGDEELGLVYAPTGNSPPDYFGGNRRPFDDQYSSSVVALDIETGQVRWSFQTVIHDLWDYDVPAQPTLADIQTPRGVEKILVQATKRGELFLLDRVTGKPLADVNMHKVPTDGIAPGERISPIQPFSDGMPSTRGPALRESMMWGITPLDQLWCRIEFRKSRYEGPMTPPGLERPNIVYPGYGGGSNWGGVAIDPDRGILVTNALRMANRTQLITRERADAMGLEPLSVGSHGGVGGAVAQLHTPYGAQVATFLSPLNVPCQQPPYGTISGIDLASRKLAWTKRFGSAEESGPLGIPSMLPLTIGAPNFAGSITTRGGLTFVGATRDSRIRAFETTTGRVLWEKRLPSGGNATPMTYLSEESGRQFVAIAAGGSAALLSQGGVDYVVAFAVPKE